jgi:hypothetical protein
VVVDMLVVLIERYKDQDMFGGLVPHLVDSGLSILQYINDTIKARNLKLVLCVFEKLSGLKINFHKSELFGFGETKERIAYYVYVFRYKEGELPFRYLGIQISHANS